MRPPSDMPRARHAGDSPAAGRRPCRAAGGGSILIVALVAVVRPGDVAARDRRLLHRLPLVRLARPDRRLARRARAPRSRWSLIFTGVFFVLLWVNLSSPTASRRRSGPRARGRAGRALPRAGRARGPGWSASASPLLFALIAGVGRVGAVERVDPVHQPRRLRRSRTPRSTPTSASTSSSCRS